ncbi:hypothetical protein EUTSA_v10009864mg [Eutrema salsugineum]|uniref:GTD-binding domain-containing protein n=1 Tax=Eutrema salsugineum TaxID=72664 RepID=V4L9H9_EUTSA|nr:hypothetical protein EUTSA_v10009864mg [Eutrema salsugineum]
MPCLDTHNWDLTGLIGAFLNLAISYFLLCTALFIHVVLKFLGFLGFTLPRFHSGRFGDANMKKCLRGDLVNCASERISVVDRSIKTKIPFGSITSDDDDSNRFVQLKLVRKNGGDISNARGKDETEDDVSREEQNAINNNLMTVQGMKGKRFATRRSRNGLKNRRRGLESISSSQAFDETVKELSFVRNAEENSVKDLEESLKEERAARAAICVELDKERSAAASAADEAMAMIHRLQDEKAAIEMEAMQFQRVVEEKSTFDAEEMVILKDILIRREREKHFLEKEVEAYRQLLFETDELECSLTREQNLPESTEKKVKPGGKQNQDSQERRALLVQEVDGTVLDMPYREEGNRDLYKSDSEVAYSHVRDVHMVKDETENFGKKKKKKNLEGFSFSKPEESLQENSTIVSGIARKLPPLCRPRRKSLSSSGSRRKSMSAVDYERLKIENEVELLRERLKAVQEEREELTRRASLPSLSSKDTTYKVELPVTEFYCVRGG